MSELPRDEANFPRKENEITATFGTSTSGPTNTMDILFRTAGNTDLNDPSDTRVIYTPSRNVRGDENRSARLVFPESLRGIRARVLSPLGVDLIDVRVAASGERRLGELADERSE